MVAAPPSVPPPTAAPPCVDHADTAWVLLASMLVLLMIPALGLFEAGLLRAKSTTSILTQVFAGAVLLCFIWQLIGFSLVFGDSWHGIIGSPATYGALVGVEVDVCLPQAPTISKRTFAMFQMMFAAICPLLSGRRKTRIASHVLVPSPPLASPLPWPSGSDWRFR